MIKVREIKLSLEEDNINNLKNKVLKKLKLNEDDLLSFNISKRSIDARRDLKIVYEVELESKKKVVLKKDVIEFNPINYEFPTFDKRILSRKVLIVGAGPAGLFCSYFLAKNGFKPVVIDRGEKIEDRIKTVDKFFKSNILNESSNVLFGEGGAGTFSDGKLNTLVKDKKGMIKEILKIFVSCGADERILYEKNPHIGTDILRKVIINLRNRIIELGGEFRYSTHLDNIVIENNSLKKVIINGKEEIYDDVVLAIGHSARDTFKMLLNNSFDMTSKPFAVGLRISNKQELINKNQYGKFYDKLPPASYKLTYTTKEQRGVYSFCMCPGGYVINSSNEKGKLLVNGMSNNSRDSENANSAIVVTVSSADFGDNVLSGMYFQEELEKKAYRLGKGSIPVQNYIDYKNNVESESLEIKPLFKGNYKLANLNLIFPNYINKSLKEGIDYFNTKIPGFSNSILAGVESRTSSPVKIIRDDTLQSNVKNIYPCGEGAGYAGGITTSCVDGIKIAEAIVKNNS